MPSRDVSRVGMWVAGANHAYPADHAHGARVKLAIVKKSGGRLKSGSVDVSVSINATCKRSSPMKREAYRAVDVKRIFVESLVADTAGLAAVVGLDVAKSEFLAVVRWSDGRFERPWRAKNPEEIPDMIHRLQGLADGRSLTIAMESTGTYGDALRQALTDAKLTVHRVSGKAVHDYAEIFDGVSSQHDGKDAAMVAELAALGKSSPWPYEPLAEADQELRYWVEHMDIQQRIAMLWLGRLEALLARHWPEATRFLELSSGTLLQILVEYGGPAALAADAQAAKRIKGWGGPFLKSEKIERFLQVSASSVGVRQTAVDRRRIEECAQAALSAKHEVQKASQRLENLAQNHAIIPRHATIVGWATACVLWVYLGNPSKYHCAEAYRKAMGLNLKERSSGRHQGLLKITKRGPGAVRRWLYFAAMRLVQKPDVVEWYGVKKGQRPNGGKRALIAVMRKLVLGLYVVGVGAEPFDARRLFSPTVKHSRRGAQQAKKNQKKQRQKV
jgi:transposase